MSGGRLILLMSVWMDGLRRPPRPDDRLADPQHRP
jgi:hypothetical protein